MSELLDPDGPWSLELLELMLPMAIYMEAEKAEVMFGASLAAVSSIAGREGVDAFRTGLASVKEQALNSAREAKGLPPGKRSAASPGPGETPADAMMAIARKLGMRTVSKAKPAAGGTRLHRGRR
jgi:hypothetical protein